MVSFTDRIRKLLRRPPKQRPPKSPPASNISPKPPPQQPGDSARQAPLALDGADDSSRAAAVTPATSSGQLRINLTNQTTSSQVYAYITGSAIDRGGQLFLLSADGRTPYYPTNPSSTGTKLTTDISIRLGAPGSTTAATIPRLAGGRIWFSIGSPLVFAVNPGPGLVEPSVFNQADPNIGTNFGFAEFTFNASQVFANISYVDFVSLPIALTLRDTGGRTQRVAGLPPNGLDLIANGLRAQTTKDGRRWSSLIVPTSPSDNRPLRILSPNSGLLLNPTWFQNYWQPHVDRVWDAFTYKQLTIDTQSGYGEIDGQVRRSDNLFDFGAQVGTFAKPSTADIFSCSTGPFATGTNAARNTVIPRLAAALNRSTLVLQGAVATPAVGEGPERYYTTPISNHYARIVHEANIDKHGYAFPYDDVTPTGGVPQEGAVFSFSPDVLSVTVGGR